MAAETGIEWTDATWNPIRARNKATGGVGHFCAHASDGCRNCYAERLQPRFQNPIRFAAQDRDKVEIYLDEAVLLQPLRWRRPRRIFPCSMTDLFGEWVTDDMLDRIFAVMALCPQHTFQPLTKRAKRMRDYFADADLNNRISAALGCMLDGPWVWKEGKRHRADIDRLISAFLGHDTNDDGNIVYFDDPIPLPNVWLGVSVEDQKTADERIPLLLDTPAAKRVISAEPLLGPIDLEEWLDDARLSGDGATYLDAPSGGLDQVIAGGESGPNARSSHPDWFRSLRDQCTGAGVAFFFKQWGEWAPSTPEEAYGNPSSGWLAYRGSAFPRVRAELYPENGAAFVQRVGKKAAGRTLDGRTWDEFPA